MHCLHLFRPAVNIHSGNFSLISASEHTGQIGSPRPTPSLHFRWDERCWQGTVLRDMVGKEGSKLQVWPRSKVVRSLKLRIKYNYSLKFTLKFTSRCVQLPNLISHFTFSFPFKIKLYSQVKKGARNDRRNTWASPQAPGTSGECSFCSKGISQCFASVLTHILGFHPAAVSDKESTGELNMLRNKILCFLQPFTLIPPSTKYLRFSLGVKFPF